MTRSSKTILLLLLYNTKCFRDRLAKNTINHLRISINVENLNMNPIKNCVDTTLKDVFLNGTSSVPDKIKEVDLPQTLKENIKRTWNGVATEKVCWTSLQRCSLKLCG